MFVLKCLISDSKHLATNPKYVLRTISRVKLIDIIVVTIGLKLCVKVKIPLLYSQSLLGLEKKLNLSIRIFVEKLLDQNKHFEIHIL